MNLEDSMFNDEKYLELNNELVIPEYNRFLEKLGIDFSSSDITTKFKLNRACINLFNKSKKKFHLYKGKIVAFHFTTEFDFHYDEWPISDFLIDAGTAIDYIEELEAKLKFYNYTTATLSLILMVSLIGVVANLFIPNNGFGGIILILLLSTGIFSLVWAEKYLSKYFQHRKVKSAMKQIEKIKLEIGKKPFSE